MKKFLLIISLSIHFNISFSQDSIEVLNTNKIVNDIDSISELRQFVFSDTSVNSPYPGDSTIRIFTFYCTQRNKDLKKAIEIFEVRSKTNPPYAHLTLVYYYNNKELIKCRILRKVSDDELVETELFYLKRRVVQTGYNINQSLIPSRKYMLSLYKRIFKNA